MILRYTCTQCGIVTRVEENQDHVAYACQAPYDIVNEEESPLQIDEPR